MMNDEDQLLIDAMNERVKRQRKREARSARVGQTPARWSPPRCGRPGCRNAADIEQKDYTPDRDFYCSATCFRIVRDAIHGARGRFAAPSDAPISTEEAEPHA